MKRYALKLRRGILHVAHAAASRHSSDSLSAAEVFMLFYFGGLHVDPKNPEDPKRDRFVLSKDRCASGLYAALVARGFSPKEDLLILRHIGSCLQGHPDMKHIPGVSMSSSSLDQDISAAVSIALTAKIYGESYRTYVLLGDGEIEEGEVQEIAMLVGFRKLDNLVVIVDNNNLQIDGPTDGVNPPYPTGKKFETFNFHVINMEDGNDFDQLRAAFAGANNTKDCPIAIIVKTAKGKGASFMENQVGWHNKDLSDEELVKALAELDKVEEML